MSMQSDEKPVPEHATPPSSLPAQQATPSALPGSGQQLNRPVVGGLAFGKDETATDILTKLAKPQVFPGPEVDLQKQIVVELEKGITELNKTAAADSQAARAKVDQANDLVQKSLAARVQALNYEKSRYSWSPLRKSDEELESIEKAISKDQSAAGRKYSQQVKAVPAKDFAQDVLYIGSIVLNDIPATADGDAEMIKKAELVETDYALNNTQNGAALPKAAKVDKGIVTNTLKTMIAAGQIEYLRRSGIIGDEWQVIVEIHYYRNRSKTQANLHKDTLGQTLFVNLNYTNEAEAPGPEYIVNPPTVGSHEEKIAKTLPAAFNKDLSAVRKATDPASRIENSTIPPHGVVAFVDEAIHHATPLIGHRHVRVAKVREWVTTDKEFLAGTGKDEGVRQAVLKLCDEVEEAADQQAKEAATKEDKANAEQSKVLSRPGLRDVGMSDDDIDSMLSAVGPNEWNAVAIPSAARADGVANREPIRPEKDAPSDPAKPNVRMKRSMSYSNLADYPRDDPAAPRRFFRTWVRAVRKT